MLELMNSSLVRETSIFILVFFFIFVLGSVVVSSIVSFVESLARIRQKDRELDISSIYVAGHNPRIVELPAPMPVSASPESKKGRALTALLAVNGVLLGVLIGLFV